jgi:hypothetical protein
LPHVIFLSACLLLGTTLPAYAYVDPGIAAVVIQGIVGAIAVVGFYFRSTLARVMQFIRPARRSDANRKDGKADG